MSPVGPAVLLFANKYTNNMKHCKKIIIIYDLEALLYARFIFNCILCHVKIVYFLSTSIVITMWRNKKNLIKFASPSSV